MYQNVSFVSVLSHITQFPYFPSSIRDPPTQNSLFLFFASCQPDPFLENVFFCLNYEFLRCAQTEENILGRTHPQPSLDLGATMMLILTSCILSLSCGDDLNDELSAMICQLRASVFLLQNQFHTDLEEKSPHASGSPVGVRSLLLRFLERGALDLSLSLLIRYLLFDRDHSDTCNKNRDR
jgi:hypothetical protein